MSVHISLTLEASEMFLSLHMIFSLERAAVVWAILERISDFDPSLEMIALSIAYIFTLPQGTWSFSLLLASGLLSWSLFGSHLGCLSSFLSCLDRSPFCPVILPYVLKTIWWMKVILWIMDQYDTNWYHKIYVGQWPIFRGPVILLNIFKSVWWRNNIFGIVSVPDYCLSFYFAYQSSCGCAVWWP